MKAIEYKAKLDQLENEYSPQDQNAFHKAIQEIYTLFINELADELNKTSNYQKQRKYESIKKQLNLKWIALSKLDPRIKQDGFKSMIEYTEEMEGYDQI